MTQDEIRSAVLAALIDYDTFKKTRRTKAVKEALRNTLVATVIGSAGISTANPLRNNSPASDTAVPATSTSLPLTSSSAQQTTVHLQSVVGVVHFGLNRHLLATAHKDRLQELVQQLPHNAEVTVIAHTDASGGLNYNKHLGKLRAHSVAKYLAEQGVKVKSFGSQRASCKLKGWTARGVDILVRYSAESPVAINLPPLIKPHYAAIHELANVQLHENHTESAHHELKIKNDDKTADAKVMTNNTEYPQETAVINWWDEGAKLNDKQLNKVSWGNN